jgi:hypothetical protein
MWDLQGHKGILELLDRQLEHKVLQVLQVGLDLQEHKEILEPMEVQGRQGQQVMLEALEQQLEHKERQEV